MCDKDDWKLRKWVETWKKAGPALERIRREELRAFKHEENVEIIDALLEIGCRFAIPRDSSGLVEQQRWFRKARR